MQLSNFEKIVIVSLMIVGLLGGVLLVEYREPIIPSIFIALGISTVVYYFLGGIQTSEFNMGPVKLGGSIAALIASAWFINGELDQQANGGSTRGGPTPNMCYDQQGMELGKLPFADQLLTLNSNGYISLNDTINIGRLSLEDLQLHPDYSVITASGGDLGELDQQSLAEVVFEKMTLSVYTEVRFNYQNDDFNSSKYLYDGYWSGAREAYRGRYRNLPFEMDYILSPTGDKSPRITLNCLDETSSFTPLIERDKPYRVPCPQSDTTYFIRLLRWDDTSSSNNFIIYSIYGWSL